MITRPGMMSRPWKRLGRQKHESIPEDEEASTRPRLQPPHNTDDAESQPRRASEPTSVTRASLYHEGVSMSPKPQARQSTSGSSFTAFGSQLDRKQTGFLPLTKDEFGLSLVSDCDSPIADLIFVHGLGGSSKKTWSYERDIRNFWPPWLGLEMGFSNTRIFTFGYNAHFAKEGTTLSILDFAKDLLFQAKTFQHEHKEDGVPVGTHPMVFVVHSMGGLVLKKAYIVGKTDEHFANMMSQTYGIVFLGTPHRGSNLASTLNNILRASPSLSAKIYVNELEKGSTTLHDINEQFRNMCGDLALVSFHETLKTSIGPSKTIIVERESAILGYPGEISAPLHADHHGLTKFKNREDRNYRDVRNVLRSFVRKIRELGNLESKVIESPVVMAKSLNEILGIKHIDEDLETLRNKHLPGTGDWILQKSSFRDWTEETPEVRNDIYWLTGPPGSGKSTLSSCIVQHLKRDYVPGTCAYHFFKSDNLDTRTTSYFLRSLAFQIAQEHDEFRYAFIAAYQKSGMSLASQKYQIIWDKIFGGILFQLTFKEPLFWVLDGVDEAESPGILCDLITKIISATTIKILLVSRPTKILVSALSGNRYVCHEEIQPEDTMEDIHAFVSGYTSKIIPDNIDEQRTTIIDSILSRANGSFLWVNLALERISDNWYTPDDIQTALEGIPEGMDTMYSKMIEDVAAQSGRNRALAIRILTWTSCAFRPLSVDELLVALHDDFAFQNVPSLEAAIAHVCGNFIDIKKSKVSLTHETARTFLLTENFRIPISIDRGSSHEHIAIVCMKFLSDAPKWKEKFEMAQESDDISETPFSPTHLDEPFLWYATTCWAYHVSCATVEVGKTETLQAAVFDFLDKHSLLWINAVALNGNLRILTRSAAYLKAWVKKRNGSLSSSTILSREGTGVDELLQWANDLIRIVGRFGVYLAEDPSAIHKYVVPFCPHGSMLYTTFQYMTGSAISVKGISSGKWDDCLARLTMGNDERASKVLAKDNFFLTLIKSSGTLVVWLAETCEETRRIHHGEYVTGLQASKTSNLVATAGIRTIRVWDVTNGESIYSIPKSDQGKIMAMAFFTNDTELSIAYDDCTIQCINLETAREQWSFRAIDPAESQNQSLRLMSFSHDAKRIAISYRGSPVFVWKIRQRGQKPIRCVRRKDMLKKPDDVWNPPEVVLWQQNSPNILIIYQDAGLVEFNLDSNSQTEHDHIKAREMVLSDDGNLLLTADNKGSLCVWTTGKQFSLVYELKYDEFARDIAFSPDGQRLYDVRGTTCNVWEPDTLIRSDDNNREDGSTHESTLYPNPVISADKNDRLQISALLSCDSDEYYCVGKEDGSVAIFEIATAKQHRKLYGHSTTVSVVEMAWSRSQKYFASADDSGRLIAKRLERPANPQVKWRVFPLLDVRLGSAVNQLVFSTSEEFLLVTSDSSDRVYSTRTKQKLFQVAREDNVRRRWLQHPTKPHLLISLGHEGQELYEWKSLERVDNQPPPLRNHGSGSPDPSFVATLRGTKSGESVSTLERFFLLQDRYIVLEFLSSYGSGSGTSLTSSRRLEVLDVNDIGDKNQLARKGLPLLAASVNRLVGISQGHLVFLDHQYWVCSWDLAGGDCSEYIKHFFLPKDWLSPGALRLITLNGYSTLLVPKNGEIAVVRDGIRI